MCAERISVQFVLPTSGFEAPASDIRLPCGCRLVFKSLHRSGGREDVDNFIFNMFLLYYDSSKYS